jgi:hypothetical protein
MPMLLHISRNHVAIPKGDRMNDSYRLWGLWDMLRTFLPLYQVAQRLAELRYKAEVNKGIRESIYDYHSKGFTSLVDEIHRKCLEHDLTHTSGLAESIATREPPEDYGEMFATLNALDSSLSNELKNEAFFRITPERKSYFEQVDLFGPKVATAFSSCERDIQRAGRCFALEQEDGCVHHLMLVLERGLRALAKTVGLSYVQSPNWQVMINEIEKQIKLLPPGAVREAYKKMGSSGNRVGDFGAF